MNIWVLLLILAMTGLSGFFLKYKLRFGASSSSCATSFVAIIFGVAASFFLRSFPEAIGFLTAATAQFASFVFVSRFRQRGSFFWHTVASLAANGTWYLTMHALDAAMSYWWLYVIYVAGIVAGRIIGAAWAQYVEQKFSLKSDATRDPRLAPGQRLHFIAKEKTFWFLGLSLFCYAIYGFLKFEVGMVLALFIVIGLGILQNFTYALSTRAAQRGNNWLIALTGIAGGVTFYVSATYLFSKNMPLLLLLPYMLSTALGSTTGALASMIIERAMKLAPDRHLEENRANKQNTWRANLPYAFLMVMVTGWLGFQKSILNLLGYSPGRLEFPLPLFGSETMPRIFIMLSAGLLFFFDEVLQTLMSRAGNRNHTGYHTATCIPKGITNFFKVSYISLNPSIPDIVPIAVLSGCLGSLFGKDVSEKIERWLQAKMDVEKPALAKKIPA